MTTSHLDISALLSTRVGVIRKLQRLPKSAEEPRIPYIYQATLAHFDFRRLDEVDRAGVGKGVTESDAIAGAVGEAIERYCASQFEQRDLLEASYLDLPGPAIDPRDCVLYSEEQYSDQAFPYIRFSESAEIWWVRGRAVDTDEEIFVPAVLTYLDGAVQRATELVCSPTSNGLAAGPSLAFALRSALYELIERDAFLITWMNRLPISRLDLSRVGGAIARVRNHYRHFGIDLYLFIATTDVCVYAMMAITIDRSGTGPAAVVGLGADLDPAAAALKAVLEVCQVRAGEVHRWQLGQTSMNPADPENVHRMEDHSALFHQLERLSELSFLLDSPKTQDLNALADRSTSSVETDLATCIASLKECRCRPVYVDVTTEDVRPLGIHVVRAIATGLQPIHFGYGEERLGGTRLYHVPHSLGYIQEPAAESDLNRFPHPLA